MAVADKDTRQGLLNCGGGGGAKNRAETPPRSPRRRGTCPPPAHRLPLPFLPPSAAAPSRSSLSHQPRPAYIATYCPVRPPLPTPCSSLLAHCSGERTGTPRIPSHPTCGWPPLSPPPPAPITDPPSPAGRRAGGRGDGGRKSNASTGGTCSTPHPPALCVSARGVSVAIPARNGFDRGARGGGGGREGEHRRGVVCRAPLFFVKAHAPLTICGMEILCAAFPSSHHPLRPEWWSTNPHRPPAV